MVLSSAFVVFVLGTLSTAFRGRRARERPYVEESLCN